MLKLSKIVLFFVLCESILSCGTSDDPGDVIIPENTINNFVLNNPNYSVLATGLNRTGLDSVLNSTQQFTIFAPSNSAFNSFLSDNDFTNINDVPLDELENYLRYHLQPGAITLDEFPDAYIRSLAIGNASDRLLSMYTSTADDSFYINNVAEVVIAQANIELDNGYLNPINTFLSLPSITDFLLVSQEDSALSFSSLLSASTSENYIEELRSENEVYTVLQASEEAIQNFLLANDYPSISDIPQNTLNNISENHIISAKNIRTEAIADTLNVTAISGIVLKFYEDNGPKILLENEDIVNITTPNIQAVNGVIQVVDQIIIE
ncbi:fasciclin domain-containing protein [Zunongwangia endophytica]|uniref:Fasciclin domain-containing protein n=1 Tax=Zunongwangia endophytica TaxID=1808945 RepID=A0ABV8HBT9_9FLAO|nr:fasciclin domain-containing protein [Zunongwangia endophytica]MDN3594774.1 fasciclin domain-containing protein [Zunongwangia endophytica]